MLEYAAWNLETGEWGWHHGRGDGDINYADNHCCALTAITCAARELDSIQAAYPAVRAMQKIVGEIGPFNDAPERTLDQVVEALQAAAMIA